jgi:hypothetical protein
MPDCARIDANPPDQFSLAKTQNSAFSGQLLTKIVMRDIIGRIAQEFDDLWDKRKRRTCVVLFPISKRTAIRCEPVAELILGHIQVKASLFQVVTQGLQFSGVSGKNWLFGSLR